MCGKGFGSARQPGEHYSNCWHGNRASYHRGRVFLGSLMDIFDEEVPISYLGDALQGVHKCGQLDFLLVTKRPELWRPRVEALMKHYAPASCNEAFCAWLEYWLDGQEPKNVWMITSAEDQLRLDERVPHLLRIPAAVHGLSCEPLLEPLKIEALRINQSGIGLPGIDWVIGGGESGPGARPCNIDWLRDLRDQCRAAGVPYFNKQLGSDPRLDTFDANGKRLEGALVSSIQHDKKGGDINEWPEDLRVRKWPDPTR